MDNKLKKKSQEIINEGVTLEEQFVEVIAERISDVMHVNIIPEEKKRQISKILAVLKADSARHAELFNKIIEKY